MHGRPRRGLDRPTRHLVEQLQRLLLAVPLALVIAAGVAAQAPQQAGAETVQSVAGSNSRQTYDRESS